MKNMEDLYQHALLADVAYIDIESIFEVAQLGEPVGEIPVTSSHALKLFQERGLTEKQFREFSARYHIVEHIPNDLFGLSATLFEDKQNNNKPIVAFRGTETNPISQALLDGLAQDVFGVFLGLSHILGQGQNADAAFQRWIDDGQISEETPATIVGHSLGGHLSLMAAAEYDSVVSDVYTFNGAGINLMDDLLDKGSLNSDKITRVISDVGYEVTASDVFLNQYGALHVVKTNPQPLAPFMGDFLADLSIGNHSMLHLVDSLSVARVFQAMDPELNLDAINTIMTGAFNRSIEVIVNDENRLPENGLPETSNLDIAAISQNLVLDQLSEQLGLPSRGKEGVNSADEILSEVQDLISEHGNFQIIQLESHASALDWAVSDDGAQGIATRYALLNGVSFAVIPPLGFGDGIFNDDAYARGESSETFWASRLDYHQRLLDANQDDRSETGVGIVSGEGYAHYFDKGPAHTSDLNGHDLEEVHLRGEQSVSGLNNPLAYQLQPHVVFGGDSESKNDELHGGLNTGAGDRLFGMAGDDSLLAFSGNDYLEGGRGNDILDGGFGNDLMRGGEGADRYMLRGGEGMDLVHDIQGLNQIFVNGVLVSSLEMLAPGQAIFRSAAPEHADFIFVVDDDALKIVDRIQGGVTTVSGWGQGEHFAVTLHAFVAPAAPTLTDDALLIGSGDPAYAPQPNPNDYRVENDYLDREGLGQASLNSESLIFDASQYQGDNGTKTYQDAGQTYLTEDYADTRLFSGGDMADLLTGDDQHNFLIGEWGDDALLGRGGQDILWGSSGSDQIYGGNENDFIWGSTAFLLSTDPALEELVDYRDGDSDQNLIDGGAGHDSLTGGETGDTVFGGEGNDTLLGNTGSDSLVGGSETDILFGDSSWALGSAIVPGSGAALDIKIRLLETSTANMSYDDVLHGGEGDDYLWGELGNDQLFGGEADDVLFGDRSALPEEQQYIAGILGSSLPGAGLSDLKQELHGDDQLFGGAGNDYLYSSAGDDVLDGGSGSDRLYGGLGNDVVLGGLGNDFLYGEEGDDVYMFSQGDGHDQIVDEAGANQLLFGDTLLSQLQVYQNTESDLIGFHYKAVAEEWGDAQVVWMDHATFETLDGIGLADAWISDPESLLQPFMTHGVSIEASSGTTNFYDGDDLAFSVPGGFSIAVGFNEYQDDLRGDSERNYLFGGDQNDALNGGLGNDILDGGEGDDIYHVDKNSGLKNIIAGVGNDQVHMEVASDAVNIDIIDGRFYVTQKDNAGQGFYIDDWQANPLASIRFGDGVVLNQQELFPAQNIYQMNDGQTDITGSAGDDLYVVTLSGDERHVEYTIDDPGGIDELKVIDPWGKRVELSGKVLQGDDIVLSFGAYPSWGNLSPESSASIRILGAASDRDKNIDYASHDVLLATQDGALSRAGHYRSAYDNQYRLTNLRGSFLYAGDELLVGSSRDDTLRVEYADPNMRNTLYGREGDDRLIGSVAPDRLYGEQGNDRLEGGYGRDDYFVDLIDHDVIFDNGLNEDDTLPSDEILIWDERDISEINFARDGDDLLVDNLRIEKFYNYDDTHSGFSATPYAIEKLVQHKADEKVTTKLLPYLDSIGLGIQPVVSDLNQDFTSEYTGRYSLMIHQNAFELDDEAASAIDIGYLALEGGQIIYKPLSQNPLHGVSFDVESRELILDAGQAGIFQFATMAADQAGNWESLETFDINRVLDSDIYTYRTKASSTVNFQNSQVQFLSGGTGNVTYNGSPEDDVIFGGFGYDNIFGGAGNDYLDGGTNYNHGEDFLDGGAGDDVYSVGQPQGFANHVLIEDESGFDTIEIGWGLMPADVSITPSPGEAGLLYELVDNRGNLRVQFKPDQIEQFRFADGTAYTYEELLQEPESLNLVGTSGSDFLYGGELNDTLEGKGGHDELDGGAGDDLLLGGGGRDELYGGAGVDKLKGGGGDDVLEGGAGNDVLIGNNGNDQYLFGAGDGFDRINNASGKYATDTDVLLMEDADHTNLWFSRANQHLDIYVLGGDDRVRVNNWFKEEKFVLDQVDTAAASITTSSIESLVSAMASFGKPKGGEIALSEDQKQVIDTHLAAAWQVS